MFADMPAADTPGHTGARGEVLCFRIVMVSALSTNFLHTLLDDIRERGAMDQLTSDHADCGMSARVKDVMHALGHSKSKPCCQHQNFAKH